MTAHVVAWSAFAAFLACLAVRVTLTEAVWPAYRVEAVPRRVVRGLDALGVVAVAVLAVALATVIGPALLRIG